MTITARRVAAFAVAFVALFTLHGAPFAVILGLGWPAAVLAWLSYLGAGLVLGDALEWARTAFSEWRSGGRASSWRPALAPLFDTVPSPSREGQPEGVASRDGAAPGRAVSLLPSERSAP